MGVDTVDQGYGAGIVGHYILVVDLFVTAVVGIVTVARAE